MEASVSQWVVKGIRTGIKTTRYPSAVEKAAGVTPGRPSPATLDAAAAASLVERCPTQALAQTGGRIDINYGRCVHCFRCARGIEKPLDWRNTYQWATLTGGQEKFGSPFRRSVHIIVVDAGDCGACLNEVKQLNNPHYNIHRLGFFITPTPRHADVLLVVGPVTDHIRPALLKTYQAMPSPKRVIAVGSCAISGGIFADSFVCSGGLADVLPVDINVPGNPPPPLAIIHGLLLAVGRKAAVPET
jgi:Ni,Fe-hydrogenase III small subunit/ferredoxin-like protein FixX